MRTEYSEPAIIPDPTHGNLTDHVVENLQRIPDKGVIALPRGGSWVDITTREFHDDIVAVAKGIIANGVQAGDRIGVMSRNRYEWTLVDYAIWFAGAVSVPIYDTSSPEQIQWILSDSNAVALFVESHRGKAAFDEVAVDTPTVTRTWVFDDGVIDHLKSEGAGVPDEEVESRRRLATPESLATIIYTSGTTGRPKGCMLTHGNLMFEVDNVVTVLDELLSPPNASTLLFLPIAHVFGRMVQCAVVRAGDRLGHSADIKNLVPELQSFKPTFVLAVPRVFEKVYNGAEQKAQADGKGHIFATAAQVAIDYSRALDTGGAGLLLKVKHALFDKLVYHKLRAALGGQVEWAVSGGAPLGERLGHFFRGIGVTILEGYGLTETTAAVNVNRPHALKVGTVGRPLPNTTVRVAEDGELLYRGGQVFAGYWNNVGATAESIDSDGWFHTGDIGEVDDDGYVRITGRKKEILVTAAGKNVAPAVLEDRIRSNWLVSQCLVVGDARPFIAALITIDPDAFPSWCKQNNKPDGSTVADLVNDPDLRAAVEQAVEHGNKAVSHAEAIKKFAILGHDWTEEGGQMTPSLKLKRNVVMAECAADIEALYA